MERNNSDIDQTTAIFSNIRNVLRKHASLSSLIELFETADEAFLDYLYGILSSVMSLDDDDDDEFESIQDMLCALLMEHVQDSNAATTEEWEVKKFIENVVHELRQKQHQSLSPMNEQTPSFRFNNRNDTNISSFQQKQPEEIKLIQSPIQFSNVDTTTKLGTNHLLSNTAKENCTEPIRNIPKREDRIAVRREQRQQRQKNRGNIEKQSQQDDSTPAALGDNKFYKDDPNVVGGSNWNTGTDIGARRGSKIPNSIKSNNIHLSRVSLVLEDGNVLLQDSGLDLQKGHRYGLIGRNGVGKSTLLQKLANGDIPGLPPDLRVLLVQQQQHQKIVSGSDETSTTTIQSLIDSDSDRRMLLNEQEYLEKQMDRYCDGDDNGNNHQDDVIIRLADRLHEVSLELDLINADTIEERAIGILKGLQFTDRMIYNPMSDLSGGWRMRLALACALIQIDRCDLLLLDECTNHLDLYGLYWLMNFLTTTKSQDQRSIIIVSHDRTFLDSVCTDVIVLAHAKLSNHVGNYSEYERQQQEKNTREKHILDASERRRSKAVEFIQKNSASSASNDPNKQRQAKMIKEKKLDRIGNYREDGKRYKQFSLKKLDESFLRSAQKVHIEVDDPIIPMYFPNPSWPHGISLNDAIARMENVSFAYNSKINENVHEIKTNDVQDDLTAAKETKFLLRNISISLNRGSKVALVGKNGTGKSTLCKLISRELTSTSPLSENSKDKDFILTGELWSHPNIRIGYVTQYSVEELKNKFGDKTVMEYADLIGLQSAKASANVIAKKGHGNNIRQYLGAFGLGSTRHVTIPIRFLSGGESMRLCFASIMAHEPHLLILDESTNHVDIETLESMSNALKRYEGTVLMVSHNQAFLSGFCNELWVLDDNGRLSINHSDTESFDQLFSQYRDNLLNCGDDCKLNNSHREKARLAKKAMQQKSTQHRSIGGLL